MYISTDISFLVTQILQCSRQNIDILQTKYPNVDFSNITSNEDDMWNNYKLETIDNLKNRIHIVINYIKQNFNNKKILLVGHTTWISYFLYNRELELSHCKIYSTKI